MTKTNMYTEVVSSVQITFELLDDFEFDCSLYPGIYISLNHITAGK